jgi:4,5-dihydroxyphthalate decarboxylase
MALYTWQQGIAHRQFTPEEIFPEGLMTKVVI